MKNSLNPGHVSKKVLLPVIAVIISVTTLAQSSFKRPVVETKQIDLTESFNQIEVRGNVTIILRNDLERRLVFSGNPNDMKMVKTSYKNNKLIVDANRKRSYKKFTVYVPVSGIDLLATSGKTEILSSGTINADDLEILLNGSSLVTINYKGKLRIVPGTGYELLDPRN